MEIHRQHLFFHLTLSEGKDILGKILENTPYTGIFDESS
jgi:hypothetical protein